MARTICGWQPVASRGASTAAPTQDEPGAAYVRAAVASEPADRGKRRHRGSRNPDDRRLGPVCGKKESAGGARSSFGTRVAAVLQGGPAPLAYPVAAVVFVAVDRVLGPLAAVPAALASLNAVAGLHASVRATQPVRTLLVGSSASLAALREELAFHRVERYILVGCVSGSTHEPGPAEGALLGTLAEFRSVVLRHGVKLVLMTSQVSRMAVFETMASECDDLDLRLCDLSEFYEDTFRYTPIAEINSAWFHSILHPRYRRPSRSLKRAVDVAFALGVGVALLPALGVIALMIRRHGGSAFFGQVRIGEDGRPFTLYKLRTMAVSSGGEAQWSSAEDPRVTPLGQYLRRWHVDELPQLWNILRGEMSVVGPRPEQPALVNRLEGEYPFYHRRHTLRPGLAGWAQARCGYAGSKYGAAWKLSYDLYYLKHRSLFFDLRILLESIWQALAGQQFAEPRQTPVVISLMNEPANRAVVDKGA